MTPFKTTFALATLSLFLLAGLAPLALADDGRERRGGDGDHDDGPRADGDDGKRDDREDGPRDVRDGDRKRHRHDVGHEAANATLALSGSGATRDNLTYAFNLTGDGKAREKLVDGNLTQVKAKVKVHLAVRDANGTVVREADGRAVLKVKLHPDGNWTWKLEGMGKRPLGAHFLALRGNATETDSGFVLDADRGRLAFRLPDDDHRTRLRVTDAQGRLALTG